MNMATGTVRWFNAAKHYGFIAPDGGGPEVFVHRSALTAAKVTSLDEGASVSFDLELNGERPAAVNVLVLGMRSSE
jgi:CspA family cold shock protein